MKLRDHLRKWFSLLTIFVYVFVMLFQNIPFLNLVSNVEAENVANKDNLVLVLVDWNIYNSIKSDVSYYASYIQRQNKNTKAIVLPINTKLISAPDIQKVISNLYFNWEKTKTSFLKWIVLIWDVPLPVINNWGYVFSSIYPYVDVKDPTFIYNEGWYFVPSGKRSDAELIHWLIKFSNIADYHKYFSKLKVYETNPANFVDKKLYYDNFVSQGDSYNKDNEKLYINKLLFAENLSTKKITPLILDIFDKQNKSQLEDLSKSLEELNNISFNTFKQPTNITKWWIITSNLWFNRLSDLTNVEKTYQTKLNDYSKKIKNIIDDVKSVKNPYWLIPTLSLESSLKSFVKNYTDLFWSEYISEMDKNLQATGRYSWDNTVSTLTSTDSKDELSVAYINKVNKFLEQELDKQIDSQQYYMYYPLMTWYVETPTNIYYEWGNSSCDWNRYEAFFFWKNASDINSLSETNIYRWTFGNIKNVDDLSKIDSRGAKSSVSMMNNLFDIQTISNRGYNLLWTAKKDWDNYKKSCQKSSNWVCLDLGRNGGENVSTRSQRIFWGYSVLNQKISDDYDPTKIEFNNASYKRAWHPSYAPKKDGTLFDLAWTVENTSKENTLYTDTISWIEKYVAVWKTINDTYYGTCEYVWWNHKIAGNYYDYFKLRENIENNCYYDPNLAWGVFSPISSYVSFTSDNSFKVGGVDYGTWFICDPINNREIHYKLIDTKVKHTSPSVEEFSKFNAWTSLRPVDSKNYISFLWVGGEQVVLDYPDLFSVDVYKKVGDNYVLKNPDEILASLKSYLIDIVKDYNKKLKEQLDKRSSYYNSHKVAFDEFNKEKYKPHSYNLLDENYFVDKIWEEKLAQVAEMLYYLNLPWKEKPSFSNLQDELDYLYTGFNINDKIAYDVENYIDVEDENKVWNVNIADKELNFVGKAEKWYEAWMIISKNTDNIGEKFESIDNQYFSLPLGSFLPVDVEEAPENECGRPLWEGVILWDWPDAFMCRLKETLNKPLKIWTSSECSLGNPLIIQNNSDSPEKVNNQLEEKYKSQGASALEEFENLQDYVNNEISISTNQLSYLNEDFTGSILINKYSDYWKFDDNLSNPISSIYLWSPKKEWNCLYVKTDEWYKNTCDWLEVPLNKWKIDFAFFNPETWEWKYYSYKAGERSLGFKFCTSNNICYVKWLYFDKLPGSIKDVEIKPFSPVMVYWGENPVVIIWYDAKKWAPRYRNIVTYTPYTYDLYLDPPVWEIKTDLEKKWQSKITYNFDSAERLLIIKTDISPSSKINKFDLVLKLSPNWEKILSSDKEVFKQTKVSIWISDKKTLSKDEVQVIPSDYKLDENPANLLTYENWIKTYNKDKLLKIHIEPKINWKTLKTPVSIETTKHFISGEFIRSTTKNWSGNIVTYDKFVKKDKFLIQNDNGIDIYLLPTYKTGEYKITIKIPGLSDYVINGKIDNFPIDKLYVKLDKYKLRKWEKVNGVIYAVDKFKNLVELKPDDVSISTSSGVRVSKSGNKIVVSAIKNGYIKFKYNWKEEVVGIEVENTFLPINKKISIMYLTLLWADFWKYAPKIMANSNKNLAITTTLYDKSNIVSYDFIIWQDLRNHGKFVTYLDFKPNKFVIDLGSFNLSYTGNIFSSVKEVSDISNIFLDGIYYVKWGLDDVIKSNKFENNTIIVNDTKLIDFTHQIKKSDVSLVYNANLSKKFWVYDIVYNKRKVWELIFKGKVVPIDKFSVSKPFFTKVINWDASTNWIKALWISVSWFSPYKVVAKSTDIDIDKDKWIWFRSNFRNLSDFAAWSNVGQATRPFENELLINYWDPFVKRIETSEINPEVWLSKTYWKRVFSSVNAGIKKALSLDFNNDWLKDLVIAYDSNKLRILKNYKGYDRFEDLGNLLVLWNDVEDIYAGDVDWDWYEDLFVLFTNKTVRVYKNNKWEFSVNWDLVCLPLQWTDGEHLDYEQIFFQDMDNDWKTDIIVNDKASDVNVFFGDTYLSKDPKVCDANFKSRIRKKHIKSYALEIDENKKFVDGWLVYREWMKNNSSLLQDEIQKAQEEWNLDDIPVDADITPENYFDKVMNQASPRYAFQAIPKLLGPSYVDTKDDYIDFKKATFLDDKDDIVVYKTMKWLNGNTLLPWDKVKVTLHIENPKWKKLTYLEEFKWPFAVISENNKPILEYKWVSSTNITYPQGAYRDFLFRIDNTNSNNIEVSYEAYYLWQSNVTIKVDDWDKNNYGDIKVFVKNWCIKGYDYFQGHAGNPVSFSYSFVNLAEKLREFDKSAPWKQELVNIQDKIKNWEYDSLLDQYINGEVDSTYPDFSDNLLNWGEIDITINGPDITKVKNSVDKLVKWLCNWFSLGKSSCSGSPVPCNFAFFAPWDINVCGCTIGTDPWTPVFWRPWTLWTPDGPKRIPNGQLVPPAWKNDPAWPQGWIYPSYVRLYVSPTLSMGLWVAVCMWPYSWGMKIPPKPAGTIAWNCVVVAGELSTKCDKKDADETLDPWMEDLTANGTCEQLPMETGSFPNSPFDAMGMDSFESSNADISLPSGESSIAIAGKPIIVFSANAHKINKSAEEEELLEWWKPISLHIKTWTFKWIIDCVIKKWLNHQIQFAISQLTHMTIYVAYPDMDGFLEWFTEKDWTNFTNWNVDFQKIIQDFKVGKARKTKYSKYLPSKEGLKTLGNEISNPFKAVAWYFEDVPLVNVSFKTVVIDVPWIWKDEIDRQIIYLENWIKENEKVIESRKKIPENAPNILKVRKFINSVRKNIEILKLYRQFPLKLYKYLHMVDFYLDQVICVIRMYVKLIVWWLNTQSRIFEKWVDAIIALINVFRTWQLLIDISVDWKSSCGKCRQDTWDAYDCTLQGLCPDLPVLPIPPFKIPDIFIDFSHIDLWLNIVLPKIKIRPVPVGLFTLPNLPYVAANLELPSLPILPAPPKLPDLPWIPPMPTVKLPNLPPPPLIPKLLPSIRSSLNVFKIVGYFRCIIKNGIWLVAEWNVKTRIEQLTARHNRLYPFDFINIDYPELPFYGYDVKVDGYLRFKLEMSQLYDEVKKFADKINENTKPMISDMLQFNVKANEKAEKYNFDRVDVNLKVNDEKLKDIDNKFRDTEQNWQNKVDKKYDDLFNYSPRENPFVINNKEIPASLAKQILNNELKAFISQKNEGYLSRLPKYYFDTAEEILANNKHEVKVEGNVSGVKEIEKQVNSLVNKQHLQVEKVRKILQDLENGKKVDLNDDIFVKPWSANLVSKFNGSDETIVFKTSLFKTDKKTLDIISNAENPKKQYLWMYSKLVAKLDSKIKKYKKNKEKYYDLEADLDNTKKILNSIWWDKLAYAETDSSNSDPIIADPSQTIKGLYMEGKDGLYYNVLADKDKAKKIRDTNRYLFDDINNDWEKDLIWYDNYSVYIKYSGDKAQDDGRVITSTYMYDSIINSFEEITDKDGYILIWDSEFKIWDKTRPINNLKVVGNYPTNIRLSWRKTDDVNAYVILYTSRVDILNDIEKKYAYSPDFTYEWKTFRTYALIIYDSNLWELSNDFKQNAYIDWHQVLDKQFAKLNFEDRINYYALLSKAQLYYPNKWKYFRIYNAYLDKNSKTIKILSAYSNQDVWSNQIVWDRTAPDVTPELIRVKTSEIVGQWPNLLAYLNTKYVLKAEWEDDVWVKKKYITDDKFNKLVDGNTLNISPQNQITKKIYYLIWEDYNWNIRKEKVTIQFTVPKISIESIDKNAWKVTAKIDHDMDISAVKYVAINGNNIKVIDSISGKEIFTGWVNQTVITWSIFDNENKVILYNKQQEKIWTFDLSNWKIEVKSPYYIVWTTDKGTLYYNVYNPEWKKLFEIYIPSQELIKQPELLNSSRYILKHIDNPNLWEFNNGYCLYDKQNQLCAMYISSKWKVYVDEAYRNNFMFDYDFNSLWNIVTNLYDLSVPNPDLFTNDKRILNYVFKAKSFINK